MRLSAVVPRFKALGLRFYCLHYGVDGVNLSPDQSDSDFFYGPGRGLDGVFASIDLQISDVYRPG